MLKRKFFLFLPILPFICSSIIFAQDDLDVKEEVETRQNNIETITRKVSDVSDNASVAIVSAKEDDSKDSIAPETKDISKDSVSETGISEKKNVSRDNVSNDIEEKNPPKNEVESPLFVGKNNNDYNVIAQMNYCITALTKIINNKSMVVLNRESDQLINNLTMEQIIGLYDIKEFREDLLDKVSSLLITEEERNQTKRIMSMKRDAAKWGALSNALNPTMLLTGNGPGMGYQLAFNVLLTAARTAVEYRKAQGEQDIEELSAMWDLRKNDLKDFNALRKQAFKSTFAIYNKYHLKESDRLTEKTVQRFDEYISEPNPAKRLRMLLDNFDQYAQLAEYHYHVGMAYLDLKDYESAKKYFLQYEKLYKKAPIFRYDEMSGLIALARLANEKDLSDNATQELIRTAINNLPSNSPAILQCALAYIRINKTEKAFNLLRSGIDDPKASDRDILFMAVANLLPMAEKYPKEYNDILIAIEQSHSIPWDSFMTYITNRPSNGWDKILNSISFYGLDSRKLLTPWKLGINDDLGFELKKNFTLNPNNMTAYIEQHGEDKLKIQQLAFSYADGITEEDIEDVACFKANKDLKFLFVTEVEKDKVYLLKKDLNLKNIQEGSMPGMSNFSLSETDNKNIAKFCKKHAPTSSGIKIEGKGIDSIEISLPMTNDVDKELKYVPVHTSKMLGEYLHFIIGKDIHLMYKYNEETRELIPYLYGREEKFVFFNEDSKEEYYYVPKSETSQETSEQFLSATDIKQDDPVQLSSVPETEEKPSRWARMKSWFSSWWD